MITKVFQKFNYTSLIVSTILLLCITYYYSIIGFNWSLFNSKILNGILIFGSLMLSSYSIDTITRQLTIERSSRNAYHLLLYPLVIFSFPMESVDMRFILGSSALWSAWRNIRLFLEANNSNEKLRRLFDAVLLISFSSILILENIFIILIPFILVFLSNEKIDIKYFIIILGTPVIILPAIYILTSFLGINILLFSSYTYNIDDQLQVSIIDSFKFPISYGALILITIYFLISVVIKLKNTAGFQRRALDIVGIFFFFVFTIFFILNEGLSGSEFHYISLILVYFIAQIFVKKISSFFINFIFISIIASTIIFKFIL